MLRRRGYEVVEVRSYELDDKSAVVAAITRIAKYLVGREKQRALREDTRWLERAREKPPAPDGAKVLRFVHGPWNARACTAVELSWVEGRLVEGEPVECDPARRLRGDLSCYTEPAPTGGDPLEGIDGL